MTSVSSSLAAIVSTTLSANVDLRLSASAAMLAMWGNSARDGVGAADLVLQLEDAIEQRLRGRWTAGNVYVHRHDAVAAPHHRIGVMVVTAAVGTGTHRNDPARLGHLVVEPAQRRRHLVAQGAGHDHHVGLPPTRPEHDAETVAVIARRAGLHHFHCATGQPERHRPHRPGTRPVDDVVDGGGNEAFFRDAFDAHVRSSSSNASVPYRQYPAQRCRRSRTIALLSIPMTMGPLAR